MNPIIDLSYWQNPRNINYDLGLLAMKGLK